MRDLDIRLTAADIRQNFTRVYWIKNPNILPAMRADKIGYTSGIYGLNFYVYPAESLPICAVCGNRSGGVRTAYAPAGLEKRTAEKIENARKLTDYSKREKALQAIKRAFFRALERDACKVWEAARQARKAD